jgi:two-component system, NtrC family, sensor histidine kinase KinB
VTVRIVSGQNTRGNDQAPLQFTVTDAGPGIPAELRERVFEKFFRVEHHRGTDSPGVRGTGIGLYLCRQIIKAHSGSIWCEANENGLGACVCITLPAEHV